MSPSEEISQFDWTLISWHVGATIGLTAIWAGLFGLAVVLYLSWLCGFTLYLHRRSGQLLER